MQDYKKLKVYQKAYGLTREIYELTKEWPAYELYTLTSQIRRSAHSVNSNICEGVSRGTIKDSIRFLHAAYASLKETENHLLLAKDQKYISEDHYQKFSLKIDEIGAMLNGFITYKKNLSF
ncbi:TPA: four helix bundle protein [archaeon]|nr:four helix bundle protein [Candidatus Naiadarchaeales archaeon SRR2090159.bin1288]